jgi:tRNA(Ile)-lysidine synthase
MITKMLETIKKYNMIEPGDKVLAGVSGGPDSVALLHGLSMLSQQLEIEVFAAHLDHMIRGEESREDARFVENLCQTLGIYCIKEMVDVPKYTEISGLSTEEAARVVRYEFFNRAAASVGAFKVALGHNLDDQAETVMMRVIRGTGLKGLGGIEPVRDKRFIRPLIEVSRNEIETYLHQNGIEYRTDSTNLKPDYRRNSIRLKLLPFIEREYNPNIKRVVANMSEVLRWDIDFIENAADTAYNEAIMKSEHGSVIIALDSVLKAPLAISTRMVRKACGQAIGGLKDIELVHIKQILNFARSRGTGRMTQLPHGLSIRKQGCCLIFSKATKQPVGDFEYTLSIPGSVVVYESGVRISADVIVTSEKDQKTPPGVLREYIDFGKISTSKLLVRNRRPGDRFSPLGLNGYKKLKDFLIDLKVPVDERDKIPLVTDGENILWVVGYRISDIHRINRDTQRLLRLTATDWRN